MKKMKRIYQKPILDVVEVAAEKGIAASTPNWVEGGPGGNFDVYDYEDEL